MVGPTLEDVQSVFDAKDYARLAVKSAPAYREATPFPHVALDNFLPAWIANVLAAEYPRPQNEAWTTHKTPHADRQFLGDETRYSPFFRQFTQAISSRRFLLFLEM